MNSATETLTPVVEESAFKFVEENDVAFSLSVCREIHRIYGSYQSGELESSDSVRMGLLLTTQMLANLSSAVTKGMPSMRIQVAVAQTREMMAVMFGEPVPFPRARPGRPRLERRCHRLADGELGSPGTDATRPKELGSAVPAGRAEDQSRAEDQLGEPHESFESAPSPHRQVATPTSSAPISESPWRGLQRYFGSRSVPVQVLIAIAGCCLAAVLIDLPIAALLLFSNFFVPLAATFLILGILGSRVHRRRSLNPGR